MPDLSVLIVNYNSGWYSANLVESLRDQEFLGARGKPGSLEIVLLDNASPTDQRPLLEPLREQGIKVVYSKENLGYAGGNNLAIRHADGDFVLICNPDVVLMPGALQRLMHELYADPRVGLVGPRGSLDPGFHFQVPPLDHTTLFKHLYESAGRVFPSLGSRYSMRRARFAFRHWYGGTGPIETEAIAGYCLGMPADLARRLGPFDDSFPFYYEDDDLAVRVKAAGRRIVYVRDARAIHFYNKSAGPVFEEVMAKYQRSKSYFFRKHAGPMGHALYEASVRYLTRRRGRLKGCWFDTPQDLGRVADPPGFVLPEDRPLFMELTMDPAFVMAAGHLHEGGPYWIPAVTWDALEAAVFFLRVIDARTMRRLELFRFEKTTHPKPPPPYARIKEDAA